MESNSLDGIVVDDEMIIDVHHDLFQKDPSEIMTSTWCDFIQTTSTDDTIDTSFPPIGRSRLSFSKLSSKPPRRKITRKIITECPKLPPKIEAPLVTNPVIDIESEQVQPSVLTPPPVESLLELPIVSRETAIGSLVDFYSKFYSIVPNHGLSQLERQFLQVYFEFMLDKNTARFPSPLPMLRSIPLDFCHFYIRVLEKGGYQQLFPSDWEGIFKNIRNYDPLLKRPEPILKALYIQYFKHFENFTKRSSLSEFNDTLLEYIRNQNLEEFNNRNTELRKRILARVRKDCEQDLEIFDIPPKYPRTVQNQKKQNSVQLITDSSSSESDEPLPVTSTRKLTKTSLLQMRTTKSRAYLSFSKKGKTINLKVDIYATPAGLEIMKKETIFGTAQVYGQLIYMTFDAAFLSMNSSIKTEYKTMSTKVVELGSLCYWMGGSSILFGYGRTPKASKKQGHECRLTENCLVFGKLNDPNYTFEITDRNSSLYLPSVLFEIENDVNNATEVWSVKLSIHAPNLEESVPQKKRARSHTEEGSRKKSDCESSDSEPRNVSLVKNNTNIQNETPNKDLPKEVHKKVHKEAPKEMQKEVLTELQEDTSPVDVSDSKKHLTLRYRYYGEDETDCRIATTQFVARDYIDYSTIMSLLRRDNVNTQNLFEVRYFKEGATLEFSGWQIVPDNFKLKLVSNQTLIKILLKNK